MLSLAVLLVFVLASVPFSIMVTSLVEEIAGLYASCAYPYLKIGTW